MNAARAFDTRRRGKGWPLAPSTTLATREWAYTKALVNQPSTAQLPWADGRPTCSGGLPGVEQRTSCLEGRFCMPLLAPAVTGATIHNATTTGEGNQEMSPIGCPRSRLDTDRRFVGTV
eukprot:scaffold3749_cov457-Prasinococcus_capsulatus_cf.AAC.2